MADTFPTKKARIVVRALNDYFFLGYKPPVFFESRYSTKSASVSTLTYRFTELSLLSICLAISPFLMPGLPTIISYTLPTRTFNGPFIRPFNGSFIVPFIGLIQLFGNTSFNGIGLYYLAIPFQRGFNNSIGI